MAAPEPESPFLEEEVAVDGRLAVLHAALSSLGTPENTEALARCELSADGTTLVVRAPSKLVLPLAERNPLGRLVHRGAKTHGFNRVLVRELAVVGK